MLILRNSIFLISLLGYFIFLNKKYKIEAEFIPAIFVASCSTLMFIAGLLNIMVIMTILITIIGLILFFYNIKYIPNIAKKRAGIVFVIYFSIIIYFMFLLNGEHFTHYDNFSHWVTVIKSMLINNRMPNFLDSMIQFQSYPLGSSIFIYYYCKVVRFY